MGIAPRTSANGRPAPRARRLLQPVPLAGFALMLVGLLVVLGYSAAAGKRTAVLIAAHSLPAGTLVKPSDLRSSQLAADSVVLAALVPQSAEASVKMPRAARKVRLVPRRSPIHPDAGISTARLST